MLLYFEANYLHIDESQADTPFGTLMRHLQGHSDREEASFIQS